jgi:hypothetical protein
MGHPRRRNAKHLHAVESLARPEHPSCIDGEGGDTMTRLGEPPPDLVRVGFPSRRRLGDTEL